MMVFNDMEDVDEWLAPLGYDDFWREVEPFALELQARESCDRQIASRGIDTATVLSVLKGMARLELVERFNLPPREVMPWHRLH